MTKKTTTETTETQAPASSEVPSTETPSTPKKSRVLFGAISAAFKPTTIGGMKRVERKAQVALRKLEHAKLIIAKLESGEREVRTPKGKKMRAINAGETVEMIVKAIRLGATVAMFPPALPKRFGWVTVRDEVHAAAVASGCDPRLVMTVLGLISADERVVLSEETEQAIRDSKPEKPSKKSKRAAA
jgi:hypothetical protein